MSGPRRRTAYGQQGAPSPVDRFGVWLSARAVRRHVELRDTRVGDFGCGYSASFLRSVLDSVESAIAVDVALAPDLAEHRKVEAIEGELDEVLPGLPSDSLDVVLCLSVLEHLWQPERALEQFARILRPGGTMAVNVPSWRGKAFLEFAAFRLGLSPKEEMDDHKRYYDPADLWPMLVAAGFRPSRIHCHRHKFGLNTFAACRASGGEAA